MGNCHAVEVEEYLVAGIGHNVLSFVPWDIRALAPALSRSCCSALGASRASAEDAEADGYWRFLCQRASQELLVYVPGLAASGAPPCGLAKSWRQLFLEVFSLKISASVSTSLETGMFNINVAARFRPWQAGEDVDDHVHEAVVPLHQRVQLVRSQLGCSAKEALSVIMRARAKSCDTENIGVFMPCLSPQDGDNKENVVQRAVASDGKEKLESSDDELQLNQDFWQAEEDFTTARCGILSVNSEAGTVLAMTKTCGIRQFDFDRVFKDTSTQGDVYELSTRRLVMDFLNGRSTSVISYGQTASGKTFTMFGPPSCTTGETRGLVPRACDEILQVIGQWTAAGYTMKLTASYVELFGSEITDLLHDRRIVGQDIEGRYQGVRATDRVGHRYVLDGQTEVVIESLDEVQDLLRVGDAGKRRAATAMNERSTRAHTIFVLNLTRDVNGTNSRFFFADLGGSEQLTKSQADAGTKAPVVMIGGEEHSRISWQEYYSHRQRIQETSNINKGLFSLKRVIEALHQRSKLAQEGRPAHLLPYVPYQDSKLTMLLQEALGGAARTLIITTASMDPRHAAESIQTARFAETCAQVQKNSEAGSSHFGARSLGPDLQRVGGVADGHPPEGALGDATRAPRRRGHGGWCIR
jgi:kinesin family protein 5